MTALSVSDIANIVGGALLGDGAALVTGVKRDNREIEPGDMFLALPGERTDGHAYISAAFDAGAACALAKFPPEGERRPVIIVPDVALALRTLAEHYRRTLRIPVIGVTGSVGKTTAKEMVASVLSTRYNTLKTEKNYNNDLGVPLTLLRINAEHEAAVVELGISHFGEMRQLAEMARPDIAIYTVIGRAHLEFLGDRAGVMRAKGELLEVMEADAPVIVNGDDDILSALRCGSGRISCGLSDKCDLRAVDLRPGESGGTECRIEGLGRSIAVNISAFGRHMVHAALFAAAVGIKLGLTDGEIAEGIAAYEPVGRRASVVKTPYITIVDDCYNSNPDSAASAILSASDLGGRLVCILGDMLELGDKSPALHRETGELALSKGAALLTTGELSKDMGGEHFENKGELIAALPRLIKRGDTVLVKASRSMAFEEISESLKGMVL